MTEPAYLRIPLSEAEAHRAALAQARERADLAERKAESFAKRLNDTLDVVERCRAIIADAAFTEAGIPLRQSVVHHEHDPVEPIDLVATVKALVAKVLDLSRNLDDAAYRTATLSIERDTAIQQLAMGLSDEARASIAIDEGEDAVSTVTDPPPPSHPAIDDDVWPARAATTPVPTTKKPAPAPKPVDTRPHVATRRDAHGRRFWNGLGWTDNVVSARDSAPLDTETLSKLKPRGSRLVALDDVPALLAEDAVKDAKKESPRDPA